ncbi:glycosyl hydrolase [Catenovulum agarivorans]|uniref:glycosyl hydrolase n=1 Tax=Catenovulum agarivorans TaxID=1172192 RepID=UPI000316BD89|nr:glycosyl hydrolase [Catenovulum agarivorans]
MQYWQKQLKFTSILLLSGLTLGGITACAEQDIAQQQDVTAEPLPVVQGAQQSLATSFIHPPHEAKPLTWLHAMSGNMSKAGLTKDLEAIAEAGLGGTMLFNVTQGIPLGKVKFNSTEHIDLIGHLAAESQRLGLSFGMHNCDGWTSSGGPWITPEHSMKQITYNETIVDGGNINIKLAQPATMLDYYQDIAVIAYPSLATEITDFTVKPKITSSDANFDAHIVQNNILTDYSSVTPNNEQPGWLQFSYEQPYTLRLIDMLLHSGRGLNVSLHISDDGKNFKQVDSLTLRRPGKSTYAFDEAFAGYTAKHFRLVSDKVMHFKELRLSSTPSLDNFSGRTAASRSDYQEFEDIGKPSAELVIDPESVINLTANLNTDGQLTTTLPAGKWTIMRFGYTSTGAVNIPASQEGTGLEVDKFSKAAFKSHYDAYITNVINKLKVVAPNALYSIEIDSYEVGAQNWTHNYEQLFQAQFGYDLVPFLPLFAGKFVESPTVAEAVLWDTRDLNNKLITENYYGYFRELAHQDGIKTYLEPYGSGSFNELDVASKADLPMGEFWLDNNNFRLSASASAAHIYNKPIVAAEAFTQFPRNNWLFHPAEGKADSDKSWALGVNQHVFHRFAHQANTHVMPGMTMNRWGAHMDRTQTWWTVAGKPWFKYVARGQQLLRTGHSVADVLWFLGDATPTTCPEKDPISAVLPLNINYDCLNSEVLQQLSVEDGKITLPHGSQYKILVLNNHQTLTLKSLQKIYQLAQQGAVIVGTPVEQLAGRFVSEQQRQELKMMVDYIWSQPTTYNISTKAKTSHGHTGVFPTHEIAKTSKIDWQKIYNDQNWPLDLAITNAKKFYFTHRRSAQYDIYFIFNNSVQAQVFDTRFNISGKIPELWDADTGDITQLGAFSDNGQITRVPLKLGAYDSAFVVFEKSSTSVTALKPEFVLSQPELDVVLDAQQQPQVIKTTHEALEITGAWQVEFDKFYGLDKNFTFEQLMDWKLHPEQTIQDYSGTATYQKTIDVPAELLADNKQIFLDLGKVNVAANVYLNDKLAGSAWHAPYTIDISNFVQAGKNKLTIQIANLWVNRLLADRQLPDTSGFKIARWQNPITPMPQWYVDNQPAPKSDRVTFVTQVFMDENEPRQSSGLIGPVQLSVRSKTQL